MAKSDQAIINNASNIIARQVSHIASLVDDLLDVSRVTRGQVEVHLQPVELHGSKVSCSSPGLGSGSRFTVSLPRQLDNDSRIDRRRSQRFDASGDMPLKIMVVDDNVDAAESLGLLLKAASHEVFTEHEGQHALALAQAELPDVCLLDIGLPGMDGKELARHLRAHPDTKGA